MRQLTVTVICAVMLISACSDQSSTTPRSQAGDGASSSSPSTSPAPTGSTPLPEASDNGSGGTDADVLEEGGEETPPTWDAASRAAAVTSATEIMTAFARPTVDQGAWWRDLAPRLTPTARRLYATVDAANVPAQGVTGPAKLVDDTTPYLAGVDVPTDAGVYRVLLTRSDANAPWLADQIRPRETP